MAEFRRRRLAHQEGAGLLQAGNADRILVRHVVLEQKRGEGAAHVLGVDQVLDVEGHAVQGADVIPGRQAAVGGRRVAQRMLGA